jgi:Fe-S-cluster containining protein
MKSNENKKICAACGGRCCKRLPGAMYPSDVKKGRSKLSMRKALQTVLASGRYAVDWWEGENGKSVYYLRPHTKEGKNCGGLLDPSWGGECTFLREDGCELKFEQRPRTCRKLVPIAGGRSCHTESHSKKAAYRRWLPYQTDIKAALRDLT